MTLTEAMSRYPAAVTFRYGDGPALNATILGLVRAGRKTISCDALPAFLARGESLPEPGRIDIALTWDGAPALAIRTTRVEIIPFDQMPEAQVAAQAEFRNLDDWRQGYRAYLTRSGHFAPDVPMVVETFHMIEDFQ